MNLPDWRFSKRGTLERGSLERGSPERGSLMLELVLGVIIVAGLTLFTGQILARYHETKREEASALYLEKLAEAAASYAGSAAFQSAINLGHLGSDDPSLTAFPAVDIATLKTEGYLPPSFPATDAYGGTPRILYQEGVVQKAGEGEDKNYVLNSVALLDHPAAMSRPRGMRILSRVLPFAAKGAGLGYFSAGVFHRVNGMTIEGAEAASLRGTTTAPTSLALMRSSPMKGRASGTPLDITVPPLDVSAYAAALGTAIEEMAKKYEDKIKEKLRFDWNRINAREQMKLGPENFVNGVPQWDIPPHTCPEGFAPEVALYDKTNVRGLSYSDDNMGDEQGDEGKAVANTIKIRLPNGNIQTVTHASNYSDGANIRRKIYSAKTRQTMSMARTLGTEGDRIVLAVTPKTVTIGPHGRRNGHSHSHIVTNYQAGHSGRYPAGRGEVTEASWSEARAANACLRNTNSARPTAYARKNLTPGYAVGWWNDGSRDIFSSHHHPFPPQVVNRANECTYVKRNEVTPIRKCNFDKEAYYKRYPMRVRLVPPEEE